MANMLLCAIGEMLYGERWQTDMSKDIHVADRTIRRWFAGEDDVACGAYRDLYHRLEKRAVETERMRFRLAGLLGARAMTLQPIPNGAAQPDIDGVWFAMKSKEGDVYRCRVNRGFFDERGTTDQRTQVRFFQEYAHSFYMAASAKFDMREFNGDFIELREFDIVLMPNVLGRNSA